MTTTVEIKDELQQLIEDAYRVSTDTGALVEEILREAVEHPMPASEVEKLLNVVIEKLRSGATKRDDKRTIELLSVNMENIIQHAMGVGSQILSDATTKESEEIVL